jgi:transcription elongation factor Elf1
MEVLLRHIGTDFAEFLGKDHAQSATKMLKDRRENIKKEVLDRISAAKKIATNISPEQKAKREESVKAPIAKWLSENALRRGCNCPACGSAAIMSGESISRGPARIDEDAATIQREVRVLPNYFRCPVCNLKLNGYQEMLEAGLGTLYTTIEDEDPIEFFGIVPEEHGDVEKLVREYHEEGYMNE